MTSSSRLPRHSGVRGLLTVTLVLLAVASELRADDPIVPVSELPPAVLSLTLTAPTTTLLTGETVDLEVVGVFADGSRAVITDHPGLRVTSTEPGVVTIDAGRRMTGIAPGETLIGASFHQRFDAFGSLVVNVRAPGDRDGDGLPDDYETAHGLDPDRAGDERLDLDADGLLSSTEFALGTDPRNPDTDGDRIRDGVEVEQGSDPLVFQPTPPLPPPTTAGPLDENCIVAVLNRTAPVRPDGFWVLPSVPAGLGQVRARANCVEDGVTRAGQSGFFTVPSQGVVRVADISFENPRPIPTRLAVTAASTLLSAAGETSQLTVTAQFTDGTSADVSAAAAGTNYTVSNPEVATIDGDGLVTAIASGVVIASAANEGAGGFVRLRVVLSGDSDGDGIPDDVELALGLDPNDPVDAFEDPDGDGLATGDELARGIDPGNPDSDGDTLFDGREVNEVGTDPALFDTDGDRFSDGLEVSTGSDPLDPGSFNLAAALEQLEVTPATFELTFNVLLGSDVSLQLTATGVLIDGTALDLTAPAFGTQFSSSDLSVCSFGVEPGRVFAGQDGTCVITATNSGFSGESAGVVEAFAPQVLGAVDLPPFANNVEVMGEMAYVAGGPAGLHVIDVADPSAPLLVTTVPLPGNANDLRLAGDRIYVAGGAAGVHVLDATDPASPALVATLDTPGEAIDLTLGPGGIYVADGSAGIQVIAAPPDAPPAIIGSFDTDGSANGIAVAGTLAVVSDFNRPLKLIDVSNPAAPALLATIDVGETFDVEILPPYAYVASSNDLRVVDLSDPLAPRHLGGFGAGIFMTDLVPVPGGLLFTTQVRPDTPMPIFRLTDPAAPAFVDSLRFSTFGLGAGDGTGLAVDGELVFLTATQGFEAAFKPGTAGDTRLYVARYVRFDDNLGVAPAVEIVAPQPGDPVLEATVVEVEVEAVDDVATSFVELLANGDSAGIDFAPPFEFSVPVALGATELRLQARGVDRAGNVGLSEESTIAVEPDPPPMVALLSPAAGDTAVAEFPLTLEAEASDNRGFVDVAFRVAGEEVFRSTTPPFRVDVSAPLGIAELTVEASATDDLGRTTAVMRTVPVALGAPPTVSWLQPADGTRVIAGTELRLAAAAADDVGVVSVTFLVDGVPVAADEAPPYRTTIEVPGDVVQLAIAAIALDTAGQTTATPERTVFVDPDQPPTVRVVTPADGAEVIEGSSVPVVVEAEDDVEVVRVTIFLDGAEVFESGTEPYAFELEVPLGAGRRSLRAVATDSSGSEGSNEIVLDVLEDVGTRAEGRAVDGEGTPLAGAEVTCLDESGVTAADGRFSVPGVTLARGLVVCDVLFDLPGGGALTGRSAAVPPVAGGVTDVGDVALRQEVLYGGVGRGSAVNRGGLLILDPSTAAGTLVGLPLEEGGLAGLAFLATGDLVASTIFGSGSESTLVHIDPDSGTIVADRGRILDAATGSFMSISDLAFDPVSGALFGFRSDGGGQGRLYRIDPASALAFRIGDTFASGGSLAFAADGTLYLVNSDGPFLDTLDPSDASLLARLPLSNFYDGLAVRLDGQIFATVGGGDEVYVIDPLTGEENRLGATGAGSTSDLAFRPPRAPARTTVTGRVEEASGAAVAGAQITCLELHAVSAADGSFAVAGVPTALGDVRCLAVADGFGGRLRGRSTFASPVPDGVTDVGPIVLYPIGGGLYPGPKVEVGAGPRAVVVADFDSDGDDDFATANESDSVSIVLGNGDGTFAQERRFPAGTDPIELDAGDLDGDSAIDLVVANHLSDDVSVLLGRDDGTLLPEVRHLVAGGPSSLALGDFDDDGELALGVALLLDDEIEVLFGDGTGRFFGGSGLAVGAGPADIVASDLDGDGLADLATANSGTDEVSVILSLGGGLFGLEERFAVAFSSEGLTAADVTGDGRSDLVVASPEESALRVLVGRGDGSFAEAVCEIDGGGGGNESLRVKAGEDAGLCVRADRGSVAVAAADFDGDGRVDLAAANTGFGGNTVSVWLAAGGGFLLPRAFSVGFSPTELDTADFNRDGVADLVVSNSDSVDVSILFGVGDGTFESDVRLPGGSGLSTVALADLDGDGHTDLVATDELDAALLVRLGTGDGRFGSARSFATGFGPNRFRIADLDGDGRLDVAAAAGFSNQVSVLLGNGDGTFQAHTRHGVGSFPTGIAVGDFNGDGTPDLASSNNNSGDVSLLLGRGGGDYQPEIRIDLAAAGGSAPRDLVAADLNGDGELDLATANESSDDVTVLLGRGDGTFDSHSEAAGPAPFGIAAADLDHDGRADMVTADAAGDSISVLLAQGDGSFAPGAAYPVGFFPWSVTVADVDGDGDPDVLTSNAFSDDVSVLLGNGDGTFTRQQRFAVGPTPVGIAAGDLDGDGGVDLVTANATDLSILFHR